MASFNRVILMGNITRDIELRYTPSKKAVTEIGLAVNEKRKNAQGEWVDEVTFVEVTLWDRNAEIASQYLSKGSPVLIEGRLKLDTWEKDGKKNSKLRVVADAMKMVGSKGGGGGGGGAAGSGASRGGSQRPATPSYDEGEYSQAGADADYGGGGDSGGGGGGGGGGEDIPF